MVVVLTVRLLAAVFTNCTFKNNIACVYITSIELQSEIAVDRRVFYDNSFIDSLEQTEMFIQLNKMQTAKHVQFKNSIS